MVVVTDSKMFNIFCPPALPTKTLSIQHNIDNTLNLGGDKSAAGQARRTADCVASAPSILIFCGFLRMVQS